MITRSIKAYTELDNYTSYNLRDLLQGREFDGLHWSVIPPHVPMWIIDSHRRGSIPDFVLNTLIHKRVFLLSQVEGTHELSSHECSLSIWKVLYALLLGTEQCVTEHDRYKISSREWERSGVICITGVLSDISLPKMSRELKIKILSAALCCPVPSDSVCGSLDQTRIFLMITAYWARIADPPINTNFLKSALIGFIFFSNQSKELEFMIMEVWNGKTLSQINPHTDGRKGSNRSKGDTILYSQHLRRNFRLKDLYSAVTDFAERYVKTNLDYIPNIIHTFAQFQSCILHTTYLNQLLNCPLENVNLAFAFNGEFLHDMYYTLQETKEDIIGQCLASEKCHFEWFDKMLKFVQESVYICGSK